MIDSVKLCALEAAKNAAIDIYGRNILRCRNYEKHDIIRESNTLFERRNGFSGSVKVNDRGGSSEGTLEAADRCPGL